MFANLLTVRRPAVVSSTRRWSAVRGRLLAARGLLTRTCPGNLILGRCLRNSYSTLKGSAMSKSGCPSICEPRAVGALFPKRLFAVLASLGLVLSVGWAAAKAEAQTVTLQNATATFSQSWSAPPVTGYSVSQAIDGIRGVGANNGWAILPVGAPPPNSAIAAFETASDVGFPGGTLLTFTLYQEYNYACHLVGKFRLSVTSASRDQFADGNAGLVSPGDVGDDSIWTPLTPISADSQNGVTLTINAIDKTVLSSGAGPSCDIYTVKAVTSLRNITGIRLEVLKDASLPKGGPGRCSWNGNFVLTEFTVDAEPIVVNADPIAEAGPSQTIDCTGPLTEVSFDGTASSDPDGDPLEYEWSAPDGVFGDNDRFSPTPTGHFPIGPTLVTLTVTDGKGGLATDDVLITVQDIQPPVVVCTTDILSLWPADHRMVDVAICVQASDACVRSEDLLVSCTISSSEPDDGTGDGSSVGDVDGLDGYTIPVAVELAYDEQTGCYLGSVALRAEREGTQAGRTYSIVTNVTDISLNSATASCVVVVPHDKRKK